jgi:hypothetical protein
MRGREGGREGGREVAQGEETKEGGEESVLNPTLTLALQVLYAWLRSPTVDLGEVRFIREGCRLPPLPPFHASCPPARLPSLPPSLPFSLQVADWFEGWKSVFPPEVTLDDRIASLFDLALQVRGREGGREGRKKGRGGGWMGDCPISFQARDAVG